MPTDYKSFSDIAKSRFRSVARELGYEQISGTHYVQKCSHWFNVFGLQKASGNDFFYVNYGITIPNLWKLDGTLFESDDEGLVIAERLSNDDDGAFDCASKAEVEESASKVLQEYKKQAVPLLASLQDLESIAERYYASTNISREKLGEHDYFSQLGVANYGFLLYRAGHVPDALKWLKEAERLMELPVYYLKEGGISHIKEKHARLAKKEVYEVEQLAEIKSAILAIERRLR